jgi:putative ATP-dependent endonuclease of the OLD family
MKITNVTVKNFRLLKNVDLHLDENSTVIVGRNNSGKTSLTELFRRMLSDESARFQLEDFSLSSHTDFWKAYRLKLDGKEDDEVRKAVPFIELRIRIEYDPLAGDLGPLSEFIIDLDADLTATDLLIRYQLRDGSVGDLFEELKIDEELSDPEQKAQFFKSIKSAIPSKFSASVFAVDPNDETNQRDLEWKKLRQLLQSGFINAQRGLDDITHQDRDVLGRILEALFKTARSETADAKDRDTADQLDSAVEKMQQEIGEQFDVHLNALMPALSLFGYPGLVDPGLSTETTLDVNSLLTNHTKVRYQGINGITLPETYNGLGTRNLILILLQLLEFFKTFQASPVAPGVHLVFIEEPEAHLHPQMQEVFIRKLEEIADVFVKEYNDGTAWPVQFVVTTHSPHMANEASFESTRYFVSSQDEPGGLSCNTQIKDLSQGLGGVPDEDLKFLHKYMTLTRCDLLFADKVVLIEGATERLLFQRIVEKVDLSQSLNPKLASQYISVVEVGGAYAHRFFGLLKFLELRTLVITDLDSVNSADSGKGCMVSEGTGTSNGCIKKWFEPNIPPEALIAKTVAEKTNGIVCITYQIPEVVGEACGRSFEASFILANQALFGITGSTEIEKEKAAWDQAKVVKKTDFALKYALESVDWTVPKYLTEGLEWLSRTDDAPAHTHEQPTEDAS